MHNYIPLITVSSRSAVEGRDRLMLGWYAVLEGRG
jgi:hypothetical protein